MINRPTNEQLEYRARALRGTCGYTATEPIDGRELVANFLSRNPQVRLEIVPDAELRFSQAQTSPELSLIKVRQSDHTRFLSGEPHQVATLLEEVAHLVLQHRGTLNRMANRVDLIARANPARAADEREAKHFVAVLLVPTEAGLLCGDAESLAKTFGVSRQMAGIRWQELEREKRRRAKLLRPIPADTQAQIVELFKANRYQARHVELDQRSRSKQLTRVVERQLKSEAALQGYSLEACPSCSDLKRLKQAGCETCQNCGWTTCD
jgi:hypothetical protein